MKLNGWMLEWHLKRKHGMIRFEGEMDAMRWHAIDHKLGARHKHEEARGR